MCALLSNGCEEMRLRGGGCNNVVSYSIMYEEQKRLTKYYY